MDRPRLAGGGSTTFLPSIRMLPPVTSSSPAISRSSVGVPQPDGPTKTTKEPSAISRSAPLMMLTGPKDFLTPCSVIWPIVSPPPLLHGAEGQAADQLPLTEPSENKDRRDRERGCGRQFCPEQSFRTGIGRDEHGERRGF